eukprot:Phypoly_transcript_15983.p1 GENE.Phypoly_transcript_15983~~Phypoly_transcript_15983.p1  ORF type:complete len:147 (+),score=17.99 Phypoly_transcript_15983:258-698(+)
MVPFAGQNINITRGAVKYSARVSEWPFRSITHKLQIGLNSDLELEYILSEKDFPRILNTNLDFSGNVLSYSLSVNQVTLYARFLDIAVIDGKLANVQYTYDTKINTTIVTIPHFWDSAEFDPDFEVLVHIDIGKKRVSIQPQTWTF